MIHINFIINRLDISSSLLNNKKKLKDSNFKELMGYNKIIEELNSMEINQVFYIVKELDSMGGVYKDFSEFLIKKEVLSNKFFELDEMFDPSKNNLTRMMFEVNSNNDINDDIKWDKELIDKGEIKKLYNTHIKNNYKEPQQDNQHKKEMQSFIDKEYLYNFSNFKESLDFKVLSWLEKNVKKMTHEDYGMFMDLINKIRHNEK